MRSWPDRCWGTPWNIETIHDLKSLCFFSSPHPPYLNTSCFHFLDLRPLFFLYLGQHKEKLPKTVSSLCPVSIWHGDISSFLSCLLLRVPRVSLSILWCVPLCASFLNAFASCPNLLFSAKPLQHFTFSFFLSCSPSHSLWDRYAQFPCLKVPVTQGILIAFFLFLWAPQCVCHQGTGAGVELIHLACAIICHRSASLV